MMTLSNLDIAIILTYLASMILVGLVLRKRARKSKESYLLAGKKLPWYMLGTSDASEMFDISGTMWMVTLCFVYGLKSIWIPWLWPVFNQVFLMMFLSKWLRRSNATTGAEWLSTRFGNKGPGVRASHNVVVAFAILSCFGFLVYGFIGLGKFIEIFLPWSAVSPYIPFDIAPAYVAHFYGIIFSLFAMFYAIIGGMHSIVVGDLIKYIIMSAACISIGVIAYNHLQDQTLNVPDGWFNPFFGWELGLDWSKNIPGVNDKIAEDGFGLFTIFFMMMLFKGVFASLAGPAPNYDMQKILSTKSPAEAAKMSGFVSIILLPIRYSLIIGLTILALLYYDQLELAGPNGIDYERILPSAIKNFVPAGLMGLVLAGLLAAFMGTFSGTLNAAQAYIVNDIYLKYIRPDASNKSTINVNYIVGIGIVIIAIIMGFYVQSVNSVLQWIVGALYGGYIAANVLKWYWWRFNAPGYFIGMATGIAAALIFPYFFDGLPLYYWPILFLLSVAGSIIGTLLYPPTDIEVLKKFYTSVKPWGFWAPVHKEVILEDPDFKANKDFKLDMFNVVIGIIGQLCLTLLPIYLILGMQVPLLVVIAFIIGIVLILQKTWWRRLAFA